MSARWLPRPLALLCLAVLGGCTVGPDFAPPEPPQTTGYAREPLPARTVAADTPFGQAQTLHEGADIPAQWWDLFHCRQLNDLIEQALRASPDLAAARAALRQAAEQVKAQRGAYFPQVSAGLAASRNLDPVAALSASSASGNPYYSLYTGQLAVSFVPDVFGLNRRTVESLAAQQENAAFELIAADLTLTSNLVAAAIQEAGLRAQIETTRRIVAVEAQLLDVLHRQFAAGQAAETDVRAQEAALAQAQQTLPPLEKQLALQRDQLTALLGRLPAEEPAEQFALADLTLPANLPVSLPAELVAQRPDVRAAAATLHAASAQIGVAVANRLPQIRLTAGGGQSAGRFYALFAPGTSFFTLAAGATQPVFDGFTLLHRERAARAGFDQAAAQYRSTVIVAFQNVADTLQALHSDATGLQAAAASEVAARRSFDITRKLLELGAVGTLNLLNAEQTYQQARLSLIQAQTTRLADTAALFQALGGGWRKRQQDIEAAFILSAGAGTSR